MNHYRGGGKNHHHPGAPGGGGGNIRFNNQNNYNYQGHNMRGPHPQSQQAPQGFSQQNAVYPRPPLQPPNGNSQVLRNPHVPYPYPATLCVNTVQAAGPRHSFPQAFIPGVPAHHAAYTYQGGMQTPGVYPLFANPGFNPGLASGVPPQQSQQHHQQQLQVTAMTVNNQQHRHIIPQTSIAAPTPVVPPQNQVNQPPPPPPPQQNAPPPQAEVPPMQPQAFAHQGPHPMYMPQGGHMTQPAPATQYSKRERKPLAIINPDTMCEVEVKDKGGDRSKSIEITAPPPSSSESNNNKTDEESNVPPTPTSSSTAGVTTNSLTTPPASNDRIHSDKIIKVEDDKKSTAPTTTTTTSSSTHNKIHTDTSVIATPATPPTSDLKTPKSTTTTDIRDDGLGPISPTPLPPSPPPSEESSPTGTSSDTKPKKNKSKMRKAELNRKGDEKSSTGSEMDAFKDLSLENKKPTSIEANQTKPDAPPAKPTDNQVESKPSSGAPNNSFSAAPAEKQNNVDATASEKSISSTSSSAVSTPAEEPKKQMTPPAPATDAQDGSIKESTPENHRNNTGENGDGKTTPTTSASSSKSSSMIKLKYEYKDGQWSPLNIEGKKQYDREFLLQLQSDPMSKTKPENLPNMEIIKSKLNDSVMKVNKQVPDFMPAFNVGGPIVKTSSRGPINKRPSRDGRGPRGIPGQGGQGGAGGRTNPPMVISGLSFQEKVDLHTAENAWKPSKIKETTEAGASEDAVDTNSESLTEVGKKVRAILNKLTPQKFGVLIVKFENITIDTDEKLNHCIELVFEKAVDEPGFSVAYAKMCEVLQRKQVSGANNSFRKLLITKCQKEFERDYMLGVDKERFEKQIAEAETEDKKKELKLEYEYAERAARRRSLGNIQFIGELYKLKMLTARIMHECITKLLRSVDEESLECLCRLLATVGKDLEKDTNEKLKNDQKDDPQKIGIRNFNDYFSRMGEIVHKKTTSSRVRFALQDAIELRQGGWVPRREQAGPKTIDQIHKEVEREKKQQQLLNYGGGQIDNRSGSRGGPNHMQGGDKRGSRSSQNNQQQGEGGWNVVTKASVRSYERIDMNKIKNASSSKQMDADNIQLGPGSRGSTFTSWGKGSTSGSRHSQTKANDEPPLAHKNRFGTLSAATGDKDESDQQRRSSSRGSRGGSADNDRDRSRREMLSYMKAGGKESPTASDQFADNPAAQAEALKGSAVDEEEAKKLSTPIIEEFINNCDYEEALECIREKMHPKTIVTFVDACIGDNLDKSTKNRNLIGTLLNDLVKKQLLLRSQLKKNLDMVLEFADDYIVDIPTFWTFFAEILTPLLEQGTMPMSFILDTAVSPAIESKPQNGQKFVVAMMKCLEKSMGRDRVGELWNQARLSFQPPLFSDSSKIQPFLAENKLEYLGSNVTNGPSSGGSLNHESVGIKIRDLLKKETKEHKDICDWIDQALGQTTSREPWFIRILVDECFQSAIKANGPKFDNDIMSLRAPLLKIYLDNKPDLQLQALFAIQRRVHKLDHPVRMLHQTFEHLLDIDLIDEDVFYAWEKCDDPAEAEGKGVAIKATTQFFTWLREAEEEPEDGEKTS